MYARPRSTAVGRLAAAVLSVTWLVSGCIGPDPVDLTGKACPCAEGWTCDTARDRCVRLAATAADAGSVLDARVATDAGRRIDAGRDGGYDAGSMEIDAGTPGPIWVEAEDGSIVPPMVVRTDADASNDRYVRAAEGTVESKDVAPVDGVASLGFIVDEAGSHTVWGRVIAPANDANSFWVRMDDGPWIPWNQIPDSTEWIWDDVHDSQNANERVVFELGPGPHTFHVTYREVGTRLDRIAISSDPAFEPSGPGP